MSEEGTVNGEWEAIRDARGLGTAVSGQRIRRLGIEALGLRSLALVEVA